MIKETLVNIGSDVARSVEKHSPEICLGIGIVSMIAATVCACKGTIKAKKTIEDAKDNLEAIEASEERGNTWDEDNNKVEYTAQDARNDRLIVIGNTGIKLVKEYGLAAILTATGIALLVKGHNIMRKRNLALIAAYEGISSAFKRYRKEVQGLIGDKAANNLKLRLEEKEVEVDTWNKSKDGKPKTKKEKLTVVNNDSNGFSPYSRIYDSCCPGWDNDPQYNLTILRERQAYWNDMLKSREDHTVFLNEIYRDLGYPTTAAGQVVGWSLNHDDGDGYIDFGIYNMAYEPNRDFVNGYEPCCLLDFNVDDTPVIGCLPKYGAQGVDYE